ncbi:MAG: PAS domain S-box protein [Ignavibacteria bacterium]
MGNNIRSFVMKFRFQEKPLYYIMLFILLVIVISIAGIYYYGFALRQEKIKAYNTISTLARLKVSQISKWREERLGEAKFIQSNSQFKRLVSGYLKYPQFYTMKNDIVEWLRPIKENHEYVNISIIDTSGETISLFKESDSLNIRDKILYNTSLNTKEVILSGFYKNDSSNEVGMGSFVPLFLPEINKGNTFAVLELRINPRIDLYPLIELSPIASKTAESFIVEEQEDSVVFLSDLKFRKNSAVSFKLPLSTKKLPAAMAIKGMKGIYEGIDYNGVEVLADLNKIPRLPWYIISKINLNEVYAPVKEQAFYILAGVLTLILLSGSIVYIAWKNEKMEAVKNQLNMEREKKDLFKNMSEGYAYCKMFFENDIPLDFQFIEVNDAFTELTGLKNIMGKRVSEINPKIKKGNLELFRIFGRVAQTGMPEKFENYRADSGKWVSVSAYSPRGGYFVAIINDITAEKKSLIELKKLSSAVEQSPASVVITDLNGVIQYVNPKFTEVSGYAYNEAIGKNPRILKSGKTPEHIYVNLWKMISTGNEWKGELFNKKKNGELFWEYISISPIKNESGAITHYVAVKEDITEQKQTARNLEEALIEVKRSNKDLEQFAYTASHDLQEPIRMIKSYAQLLEMQNKEDFSKDGQEFINYITEGASRMQQLINDLLKYSRVSTTGKSFEEVDCNVVLKDVLEDLKFLILEENAVLEIGNMPIVKGDRTQLRQLFQNLIQNAIKCKCEKNPEIKIRSEIKDKYWLFSIKDNGIGIDPKFHERIFTIFQRLHSREKYQGTGVGLAICKKIIERHGGQIFVESELNKGAVFYFTIPM